MVEKTFKIPQRKHYSGLHVCPHIGSNIAQKYVTFDKSSIYQFRTEDQYDINKLFGLSYGLHHTNSARFGWRSLGKFSTKIEILAYCYVDGKRVESDDDLLVTLVNINEEYRYQLITDYDNYGFVVYNNKNEIVGSKFIPHNKLPLWGYKLYPYFGGNNPAPHDITIKMS
tara:strand:- start:522 stop:1031 length:510 start_codon:yes stop_codon:yes gene_type:complete